MLVICGSLQLYADYTLPGLQYEREAVLAGQVWRLLTGNLVHLGWIHFLLNIGTLLIFWLLYGRDLSTRSLVRIYVLSCMGTCSGLLLFNRMIIWYAGLSGCLYGLLIYGGLRTFRIQPILASIVIVVILIKLIYEKTQGPLPGSDIICESIITDAHIYGAVSGMLLSIAFGIWFRLVRKNKIILARP